MDLVVEVYELMDEMPDDEKFNLTSQIKRCAVSIPSNIAEGAGRNTNPDFNKFLAIANGSSYELKTQLLIAQRLKFLTEDNIGGTLDKLEQIQKMNFALQKRLTTKNS